MGKKKDSISSNFENLKAEMIKKRELAEEISSKVKDNKDENNNAKNVYNNEYIDVDANTNEYTDDSVKKFILKKAEKRELPKRITYYLKPSTIGKIDKLSKKASMGKSEFVQKVLESVLENLEIR